MQSEDKPKERNSAAEPIRIGVRALAEYVHRTGGLSPVGFSDLTAQDGTRAHQRFFKSFAPEGDASDFRSEVYLEGSFEEQDVAMRITGRIDAVVRTPGSARATVRIIEAKTVSGTLDAVQAGGDPVHWAQAMLYAWMYAESVPEEDVTQVSLYYLTADTGDTREFNRQVTRPELDRFYTDTCRAYVRWASDVLRYRQARDLSAVSVRFPYPSVRSGQKPFMNQVLDAVRQKSAMLIQAPTGTGKTMSALYPAVKAVAHHLTDNVFYLTAKASTRIVAENAMDDLRRKGLVMKSITLFAKESLCPVPDLYCETRQCPYATQYHENLHAAMDRLMTFPSVSRDNLLACAETYKVCPFELSLDFSLYCDVIICDYNYAFDPRVRLVRYFDESVDARRLLLVDEAHNLPDRSREMFSAEIGETALRDMAGVLEGIDPALDKAVKALTEHFDGIIGGLNSDRPFLDGLEEGVMPADILSAEAFRSTRARPARLCGRLRRFVHRCSDLLDDLPAGPAKRKVLAFFFDAVFFLKVADEFYDPTYVTTYSLPGGRAAVRLMCLDASARLSGFYRGRFATVFFSATLSPLRYFERMLSGRKATDSIETMVLPSPFPPDNLLVCVAGKIGTRYRQRRETVWQVASAIHAAVSVKTGNYLVFLSSFEYLRQVHAAFLEFSRKSGGPEPAVLVQTSNMSETARKRYLDRFSKFGQRTLVAFAVLGGVFGEGIDLTGDRLSGVVIVGTGLPQFCPEREIMKEYYQNTMDGGFEYAYMYPGFNKVQQAAGRVIRSDEDRGFVVLLDDRYLRPEYVELFPEEWNPRFIESDEELSEKIEEFG